jgi:hypothetical protein
MGLSGLYAVSLRLALLVRRAAPYLVQVRFLRLRVPV